jgi:DNA polymerase-3 subunit delta
MKIGPARVEGFLKRPGAAIRAVLLYGGDAGLVRERAERLAGTVVDDIGDPFRVGLISGQRLLDDPARLADEAAALSLTGGRRVVRLREVGDRNAAGLASFLEDPVGEALVVVEAGELGARSSLRRLFEAASNAAAIGCYGDEGVALERVIEDTLDAGGVTATPDALAFLAAHLGSDRQVTRREIEKLVLYVGEGGRARLEDAMACVGDSVAVSLDDVVFAAGEGDIAGLDRALERIWMEGGSPVAVLRAMARHLQRLHLATAKRAAGGDVKAVMKGLRPPVFWKQEPAFARQLERWTGDRLLAAVDRTMAAELRCKRSGAPVALICHRALFEVAHAAKAGAPAPGRR